MTLWFCR